MPTTLPLFTLFAQFTIGSAAVVCGSTNPANTYCTDGSELIGTCASDAATCSYSAFPPCKNMNQETCSLGELVGKCHYGQTCKYFDKACTGSGECTDDGNLVGTCASKLCKINNTFCVGKSQGAACNADGELKGKCFADAGKCKYIASVDVDYVLRPNAAKNTAALNKLKAADFNKTFTDSMGQSVTKTITKCKDKPTSNPANGSLTCSDEPGEACDLICDDTYALKEHTKKCLGEETSLNAIQGYYEGTVGTCVNTNICPFDQTKYHKQSGSYELEVTGGKLLCPSVLVGGPVCKLICDYPAKRVKTQSDQKCFEDSTDGNKIKWGPTPGECGEAVNIFAAAHVVLKAEDDHNKILSKDDAGFNEKFIEKIAQLAGVFKENVMILKIDKVAVSGDGRRLSERTVNVDYSLQVEGEPELDRVDGAPSPENDGLLPVGAGLRGIR